MNKKIKIIQDSFNHKCTRNNLMLIQVLKHELKQLNKYTDLKTKVSIQYKKFPTSRAQAHLTSCIMKLFCYNPYMKFAIFLPGPQK